MKNIGENVGSFSLPTVVTYLVKDQVEKWSVEVMEDIFQNTMRIRYGCVVKGKLIALSVIESVNIKNYHDDCVIFNICESSTNVVVNYVELVIHVANLNTWALCNACK